MGELHRLLRGMFGAIRALFWGMALISMILVLFEILAVQIIHPIALELEEECAECVHAFESVFRATLTFYQQLLAGDSWGTVSVPIVTAVPETWLFFATVLTTVNL